MGYALKALVVAAFCALASGLLFGLGAVPAAVVGYVGALNGIAAALAAPLATGGADAWVPAPVTFGAVCGLAAFGAARPLMPYAWPGRPEILRPVRLSAERGEDHPEHPGRPLVGRDEEMRALMTFAGRGAGTRPRWSWVGGPMGIGKSRLAVE